MRFLTLLKKSSSFYSITVLYLVAVAVALAAMNGRLTLLMVVIILSLVAILVTGVALWREVRAMRGMLDGQRTEMLRELDKLRQMLVQQGVVPPEPPAKEKQARAQAEEQGDL